MSNEEVVPQRTKSIDRHLGRRLRLVRELSGQSQSDLARRMGISVDLLAQYEIGNERIPANRLFEVSNIMQVPGTWFFEDLVSMKPEVVTRVSYDHEQVIELEGLIKVIGHDESLVDLRVSAEKRLFEIYDMANK